MEERSGYDEELRKSGKLNDEATEKLDKKCNLLEKGCLSVNTFLKNKMQTKSIKIKNFEDKMQQQRQNQLSGSINQENPSANAAEAVTFWKMWW